MTRFVQYPFDKTKMKHCELKRIVTMLSRISGARSVLLRSANARMFAAEAARPMTRFVQYPFDKTKMAEVRAWVNETDLAGQMRAIDGVKDVEISFCPGEGWLAGRYIFNDLPDMVAFLGNPKLAEVSAATKNHQFYDKTREVQEFKGFYLSEV